MLKLNHPSYCQFIFISMLFLANCTSKNETISNTTTIQDTTTTIHKKVHHKKHHKHHSQSNTQLNTDDNTAVASNDTVTLPTEEAIVSEALIQNQDNDNVSASSDEMYNGHKVYKGTLGRKYYLDESGKKVHINKKDLEKKEDEDVVKTQVKTPNYSSASSNSSSSHYIQTGPRGGHYYINSHGKKVYVK